MAFLVGHDLAKPQRCFRRTASGSGYSNTAAAIKPVVNLQENSASRM